MLRAVKIWAKNNGIYGNPTGYLGGFAWAVLVAHTCQTYPKITAPAMLAAFFCQYRNWPWPKPVTLVDHLMVPDAKPKANLAEADMHYAQAMGMTLANASWNPAINVSERNQVRVGFFLKRSLGNPDAKSV